MNDKNELVFAF